MTLEEAKDIANDILKKDISFEKFEMGDPINPLFFETLKGNNVIIMNQKVKDILLHLKMKSIEEKVEVPFYLFGEESIEGIINLTHILYKNKELEKCNASFRELKKPMNEYATLNYPLYENNRKNFCICMGHTHTFGYVPDVFSYDDILVAIHFTHSHEFFENGEIGTIDCLISPNGDYNFIKYDNNNKKIYKYDKVLWYDAKKQFYKLPSYEKGDYDIKYTSYGIIR